MLVPICAVLNRSLRSLTISSLLEVLSTNDEDGRPDGDHRRPNIHVLLASKGLWKQKVEYAIATTGWVP